MNENNHTAPRQYSSFEDLRARMDAIPTESILYGMPKGKRGPAPAQRVALWRAHLYGYLTGARHTNDVIRQLRADPALRKLCGFIGNLPCRRTFNRFNARLASAGGRFMVEAETYWLTVDIKESGALPGFGERLAVDSTNIPTHARPRGKFAASDPEAGWTAKSVMHPRPTAKKDKKDKDWHFGYKEHVVVDATYGIPLYGFTTPANVSDMGTLPELLKKAECHPQAVIADKGYDSEKNHAAIRAIGAEPIIDIRRDTRKDEDGDLHTADGVLKCMGGVSMDRIAHDPDKGWLYRCRTEGCDLKNAKGVRYCDSEVWDKLPASRRYPRIPRSSPKWKRLYRMRQSVERLFKTLKESRRLASHCSRGLAKVSLHAAMSMLAFQTTVLHWIRTGRTHLLRWMVEPVA